MDPLSVPLKPTCSWNRLKLRPSTMPSKSLRLWFRYMDDNFLIQKAVHSSLFLQHVNSSDPQIQFMAEIPNTKGSRSLWTL